MPVSRLVFSYVQHDFCPLLRANYLKNAFHIKAYADENYFYIISY